MNDRKSEFIKYMYGVIKSGILPQKAAQLAYSFVLSFIPLIIILISFAGKLAVPSDEVFMVLRFLLPVDAYRTVEGIIGEIVSSRNLGTISFIPLIYFTSHASRGLIRTTDSIYSETEPRGGIKLVVLSVMYSLVLLVSLAVILLFVVFGEKLLSVIFVILRIPPEGIIMNIVNLFRFISAFLILWGILIMIYVASANVKLGIKDVYTGAFFSSAGWILVSVLFGFYVNNFSDYGILFGSLGGIFILLIWLYISSYIMLLGLYINRALR